MLKGNLVSKIKSGQSTGFGILYLLAQPGDVKSSIDPKVLSVLTALINASSPHAFLILWRLKSAYSPSWKEHIALKINSTFVFIINIFNY